VIGGETSDDGEMVCCIPRHKSISTRTPAGAQRAG
jgi:hypothetical protein